MARFLHQLFSGTCRKGKPMVLAFCWALGLFLGCGLFRCSDASLSAAVYAAGELPLGLLSALGCGVLPFAAVAFAVSVDQLWLLYGIGFAKAFCFSWVSCCCLAAWPSGGWMVRWLLLFTDTWVCILLYSCCRRCLTGPASVRIPTIYALLACMAAGLDYLMIAPLLQRILF